MIKNYYIPRNNFIFIILKKYLKSFVEQLLSKIFSVSILKNGWIISIVYPIWLFIPIFYIYFIKHKKSNQDYKVKMLHKNQRITFFIMNGSSIGEVRKGKIR